MGRWGVEYLYDRPSSHEFVNRILFSLVSLGVRYNDGPHSGSYYILDFERNEDYAHFEEDDRERTQLLASILEQYRSYDPKCTCLNVDLTYPRPPEITVSVKFLPHSGGTTVTLETHSQDTRKRDGYENFRDFCAAFFERSDFVYGWFVDETLTFRPPEPRPESGSAFLDSTPRSIMLYSDPLVDEIGRDRLLDAPVATVRELDNGVLLDVGDTIYSRTDELEAYLDSA